MVVNVVNVIRSCGRAQLVVAALVVVLTVVVLVVVVVLAARVAHLLLLILFFFSIELHCCCRGCISHVVDFEPFFVNFEHFKHILWDFKAKDKKTEFEDYNNIF